MKVKESPYKLFTGWVIFEAKLMIYMKSKQTQDEEWTAHFKLFHFCHVRAMLI